MPKKKVTKIVKNSRHVKHAHTSHPGYHPEHIAMVYRLGGGGIIILGGTVIIFMLKAVFNL